MSICNRCVPTAVCVRKSPASGMHVPKTGLAAYLPNEIVQYANADDVAPHMGNKEGQQILVL